MQTTLLGIAIAIILALVAALAGPLFIDWNGFRPAIEAEASRLIGAPVRVTGPIDAAVLPTPSLTLHGIEAGPANGSGQIRARSLGIEFHLGSLMRGQWRAREMHLVGLDFHVGVTSSGQLALPQIATGFDPDALSIERLNIEEGHATLTDTRSGSQLVLDKLWFDGDVRSLIGPFKGDGAFVIAGELYRYRVAAGRADDGGAIKIRFNIDPLDRPLAIEADGALSFEDGTPQFEGFLKLARPAGIALASGQTVANVPWQLATRVKVGTTSALFEEIEFQHGPDERAVKLNGAAELKFGGKPRLDGVLSAGQIDLDRAFATPDATRLLPFPAVKALGDSLSGALGPSIPARLGVSVDILTVAGATVHTLRGDLTTNGEAWNLEGFEFRVPGFTQVNMSGRLARTGRHLTFTGPVSVDSTDPAALIAWLQGESPSSASRIKPLTARGEVTIGADKIAVDRLKAEIDHKAVEGRLAYVGATGGEAARLEAELSAGELDIDALAALAMTSKSVMAFEMPRDVTLGVAADRIFIAGVEARQVSARLRRDAKRLDVERISVADFGGTAFDVSGHIDTGSPSPRGVMNLHLHARDVAGFVALAEKFAPDTADPLRRLAERWQSTRLDATLKFEDADPAAVAKLAIEGRSGAIRFSLQGEASGNSAKMAAGDLQALAASNVRLEGRLDADEGSAVIDLLNLGKVVAAGAGLPGQISFVVHGPLGGDLEVDGRLLAGGINAAAKGALHLGAKERKADLRLTLAAADALPLRHTQATAPADALPVTLIGNLTITDHALKLGEFSGTFAGSGLRGDLTFTFDEPMHIEGHIEADSINAASAVAAAIGLPARPNPAADAWAWPEEPFTPGLSEGVGGRIAFTAAQASLAPNMVLHKVRGVAKFDVHAISFSDVEGNIAGGRMTGHLTFNRNYEGLSMTGNLRLADADAAALLGGASQSPITGRLT
ncbi:MAG: AsmA family protein, partial [Xanthobacteraceae bacterium]